MRRIGAVLLSGGLDSTTVAAYARGQGYELTALTLRYGQKHSKEVECAVTVARIMGIRQEVIDATFFGRLGWYSALLRPEEFQVPKGRDGRVISEGVPITYVPLRNTFLVTLAAAFAESEALSLIERERLLPADLRVSVFIAANAIDYSGYPDCRPEYYEKMAAALCEGSKLGAQYHTKIEIQTPLLLKTKADIARLAMDIGAPVEYTWSCYEGGETPCGRCDSCVLRARGFTEAGLEDPLMVRLRAEGLIA